MIRRTDAEILDLVYRRSGQIRLRRRIVVALAGVFGVALLVTTMSPVLRQFAVQEINTARKPKVETGLQELGETGTEGKITELTPKGPSSGGVGGETAEGAGKVRTEGGTTRQSGTAPSGTTTAKPATATPPGTYSYEVSGYACGKFQGFTSCDDYTEFEYTFDPPTGSHQRLTANFRTDGESKNDSELGMDYRPDGVYWDHFSATFVNQWGVPGAHACPELEASPIRVWRTGAKPGDHDESSRTCSDYSPSESETDRNTSDILRSETVSIGGRQVVVFFVRSETYRGRYLQSYWEGSILPDHPRLFVEGHWWWRDDGGNGELRATLRSLTPS